MKKLFVWAVMAFIGAQAQAQIVSSRSSMTTREVIADPVSYKGWSTFGVEYLSGTFSGDGVSDSFSGLAINYTKAVSITQSIPLFIEWGIGAQYSFFSDEEQYEIEHKVHYASVKVPVNLVYDFQIPNTKVNLDPYLGIKLRGNVWGESKYESKEYDVSKTYNLFDSDESDCKRFQVGWNIGVKARFNNAFYVGIGYGSDFIDFAEEESVKINELSLSLGVIF